MNRTEPAANGGEPSQTEPALLSATVFEHEQNEQFRFSFILSQPATVESIESTYLESARLPRTVSRNEPNSFITTVSQVEPIRFPENMSRFEPIRFRIMVSRIESFPYSVFLKPYRVG